VRALGSDSIDHRLRVSDFADNAAGATFELPLPQIEDAQTVLLIGSNPRHDQPLLGLRIHKASRKGAKVYAVNPLDFDFNFAVAGKAIALPNQLPAELAALAKVAAEDGVTAPPGELAQIIAAAQPTDAHRGMIKALHDAGLAVLIFGDYAGHHAQASLLRALAQYIAQATNSTFNEITDGANAVGLARVGALPKANGKNAAAILAQPPKSFLVYHAGSQDTGSPVRFDDVRSNADFCVYIGAYACNGVKRTAHAVLPVGLPPEIDGSYVNVDGTLQIVAAGAKLPGDARPGWKVLRALGAELGVAGFDFVDIADVRAAMKPVIEAKYTMRHSGKMSAAGVTPPGAGLQRISTLPIYRSDAVLRRAPALQAHPLTGHCAIGLHPQDALELGLAHGAKAKVSGDAADGIELPVVITRAVPRGGAWIEKTWPETRVLPGNGGMLTVTRA